MNQNNEGPILDFFTKNIGALVTFKTTKFYRRTVNKCKRYYGILNSIDLLNLRVYISKDEWNPHPRTFSLYGIDLRTLKVYNDEKSIFEYRLTGKI